MKITRNEAMKDIRETARNVGLVFKESNHYINGQQAFKFEDRENGMVRLDARLFWTAYEDCMSGYISSYDKESGTFKGV